MIQIPKHAGGTQTRKREKSVPFAHAKKPDKKGNCEKHFDVQKNCTETESEEGTTKTTRHRQKTCLSSQSKLRKEGGGKKHLLG